MSVTVVIPTVGRESLRPLLQALADVPVVLVVDDRGDRSRPLLSSCPPTVDVLPGRGAGPAAARNVGWRAARTPWVAFLDDDVAPPQGWYDALLADLTACGPEVAATQGRIVVPLPPGRRPTDWERNVAGLATARWATADMAYRRQVLEAVGGFDERLPRAFREDADLGLRVTAAGHRIVLGQRCIAHPVRPADRWVSVRLQRGNADDPLMRRLHGAGWQRRAGVPRGRRPSHLATTAAALAAAVGVAGGRRNLAVVGGAAYVVGVAELAWRRIAPGPRTADEVITMLLTSAALPLAASWHWARGVVRAQRVA